MQPLGRLLRCPLWTISHISIPSQWRSRPFSNLTTPNPPSAADDDWNAAWESAWLPEDLSGKNRAPWEADVTYTTTASSSSPHPAAVLPSDADADAKAFVEEMEERWDERRGRSGSSGASARLQLPREHSVEQVVNKKEDEYRLKKQRIHAGLWMKEIECMEEAKLGGSKDGTGDIDRLLDSCSEIFDSGNIDIKEDKVPSTSEFKSKPDGWESTSRTQDGNIWEITQREEDILLQEFERRIAYSKFQIASFIKSHIFSRRRPIDGWKYMIEELGPNAKRGKGSVQRLPTLADPSTQPFKEEKIAIGDHPTSSRGR
ncbi:hypothetical protein Taro_005353 [Colocasia esculenta]|uniref:Mucin-like protein n=1 Tax=Colocasia esculenta TaxID=4460 RepID=A0A843TUD8_COLES|nr:hypothetical protein [Colocasia esculenta]